MTQVVEIQDSAERVRIAETVLRDLPEWFGIEEATRRYIEDAATLPTLAVDPDLGFLCLKQHTPRAAEIYVMGVRRAQHRKGIGRALVAAAETWCRVRGIPYLHVKTLGPSRPDPGYDATRSTRRWLFGFAEERTACGTRTTRTPASSRTFSPASP